MKYTFRKPDPTVQAGRTFKMGLPGVQNAHRRTPTLVQCMKATCRKGGADTGRTMLCL